MVAHEFALRNGDLHRLTRRNKGQPPCCTQCHKPFSVGDRIVSHTNRGGRPPKKPGDGIKYFCRECWESKFIVVE